MTTNDPYAFGYPEAEPERDQRREFRLAGRATISIELEAAEPGSGGSARTTRAVSSDISTSGMRLVTTEPLPEGALLPASVELSAQGEAFILTMEVIWCRPVDNEGHWQSGLRVIDTGEGDYLAWVEAMARVMEG